MNDWLSESEFSSRGDFGRALRNKDPKAWHIITNNWVRRLAKMLNYRWKMSPEDTEDVCQETLLRLLKETDRVLAAQSPVGYFIRMGWNVAVDRLRSKKAAPATVRLAGTETQPEIQSFRSDEANYRLALVQLALSEMTDVDREALVGVYGDRQALMGELCIKGNSLNQRIFRAKQRLRVLLIEYGIGLTTESRDLDGYDFQSPSATPTAGD